MAPSPSDLLPLLARFKQLAPKSPWGIPHHACFPGQPAKGHVVIGFITHGNEWGSLPAALSVLEDLLSKKLRPAATVSLLLGNVEAALKNERYLEEDLNRVFTFDRPTRSIERKRAEELRPLLDACDFFFDLHQTQTPTESAFWTFPWDRSLADWAKVIGGAKRGLTRASGATFSPGKCCIDEYVRARGHPGLTLELGTRGPDPAQAELARKSCEALLRTFDRVRAGADLAQLATGHESPVWYRTTDIVSKQSPKDRLRPGLRCWTPVSKGERLSDAGAPLLVAKTDGLVLFPKYAAEGQELPPELLRLAQPVADPDSYFRAPGVAQS